MKLKELLARLVCRTVQGPPDPQVAGVVCDSRQVRPGYLFVAVAGTAQDGAAFVSDAVAKGAVAVVTEHPAALPDAVTGIVVADARLALAELAKTYWQRAADRLQMVGITGTNGKTTVAYLVRDILEQAGRTPGLLSTVQYRIGSRAIPATRTTPDAPALHRMFSEMESAGCGSVVMEVSSHALVQKRVAGIDFDVALFTNLSRDHLDYHETMEAYYRAKATLFMGLAQATKPGVAIVNTDDEWGRRLVRELGARAQVIPYGLQAPALVTANRLNLSPRGSTFELLTPWGRADVAIGLLGRFNVLNALAATAAAGSLGIGLDTIVKVLQGARPVPGRLQEIASGRGFQVFVDYAHTDDALEHVLATIREVAPGRLILVFGCGGNRDKTKRPIMGAVAARLADHAFVTSDNPRKENPQAIIDEIRQGAPQAANLEPVVDRREAISRGIAMARPGDVVLVAGKGHETFQEFANRTVPFDDVQVVRDLLTSMDRP